MTESPPAFALKGQMLSLATLELYNPNIIALATALKERLGQNPAFFDHTPVVIDLSPLQDTQKWIDFPALVSLIGNYGLIAVGVRGGNETQRNQAQSAHLALFSESRTPSKDTATPVPAPATEVAATSEPCPPPCAGPTVISHPLRSGQQAYARGGDLVVEAAVSNGAEAVADGSIHILGALRGRALAGVRDMPGARIYCMQLEAELVSINGTYLTQDRLEQDPAWGKPAVIERGEQDKLIIRVLERG